MRVCPYCPFIVLRAWFSACVTLSNFCHTSLRSVVSEYVSSDFDDDLLLSPEFDPDEASTYADNVFRHTLFQDSGFASLPRRLNDFPLHVNTNDMINPSVSLREDVNTSTVEVAVLLSTVAPSAPSAPTHMDYGNGCVLPIQKPAPGFAHWDIDHTRFRLERAVGQGGRACVSCVRPPSLLTHVCVLCVRAPLLPLYRRVWCGCAWP